MFINRREELVLLNSRLTSFLKGKWQNTNHIAFLGLRRTGKTFLVKHFIENNRSKKGVFLIFFDISKHTESIKIFGNELLKEILKEIIGNKDENDSLSLFLELNDSEILKLYRTFVDSDDNFIIFDLLLKLITKISDKHKLVICFDEFQEILSFKNFEGLKNIDAIFRSELQNQLGVFYIITGSYPTILKDLLQNPKKMLYSHFEIQEIGNFDKNNSLKLIDTFGYDLDNSKKVSLYKTVGGNPYLIGSILKTIDKSKLGTFEENLRSFLFDTNGQVYNHYEYILSESLGKIGNSNILLSVLKNISLFNDGLSLKEIGEKTGYKPQSIVSSLKNLVKIDIIYQSLEKKWKFRDTLFQYFIAYKLSGIENYEYEKNSYYFKEIDKLQNNLNAALTNLGKSKEFELYYEVRENMGRLWRGLKLPIFKTINKNYYTPFGEELDLYCETLKGNIYVFELKYKNKQIGEKEVEKFINKIQASKYFYVSKGGFTTKVLDKYSKSKNVILMTL